MIVSVLKYKFKGKKKNHIPAKTQHKVSHQCKCSRNEPALQHIGNNSLLRPPCLRYYPSLSLSYSMINPTSHFHGRSRRVQPRYMPHFTAEEKFPRGILRLGKREWVIEIRRRRKSLICLLTKTSNSILFERVWSISPAEGEKRRPEIRLRLAG